MLAVDGMTRRFVCLLGSPIRGQTGKKEKELPKGKAAIRLTFSEPPRHEKAPSPLFVLFARERFRVSACPLAARCLTPV
jgi:hypothetical protein